MSEIDIQSRLEELKYYERETNSLYSKFDNLVKTYASNQSQGSAKFLKPLASATNKATATAICAECSSEYNNQIKKSSHKEAICKTCLSNSNPNISSPIWLLSRSEKLQIYENAINEAGHLTEPEMAISFNDGPASTSSNDDKKTFAEITKYKRDIKRKRMKHRTTKAPPLTHTEELRSLISLQMELWEDFVVEKAKR